MTEANERESRAGLSQSERADAPTAADVRELCERLIERQRHRFWKYMSCDAELDRAVAAALSRLAAEKERAENAALEAFRQPPRREKAMPVIKKRIICLVVLRWETAQGDILELDCTVESADYAVGIREGIGEIVPVTWPDNLCRAEVMDYIGKNYEAIADYAMEKFYERGGWA